MGNFNSIKKELHQRIDYLNSLNIEQDTEKVYQGQLNLIDNLASISLSEDERLAYFSDHEVKQYQQKHQKFTSAWEIFLEGIMNKWLSTGKCDKNKAFLTRVKRYYLDTYKTTIDNQEKLAKIRENT